MSKTLLVALFFCAYSSFAQQAQEASSQPEPAEVLREVGSDFHNSIKLLQNRFRIDYEVDEVTLVFFRKFGSAPVVLVKPDGTKIFQGDAEDQGMFWYDSATYDMINIKKPTPGPWQAVGQILPGSRVMVLSELQLHADPLPEVIFSGEILKQTAYLTNGGEPINYTEFRDVVGLDMKLVSTNNPNYNNFGADEQTIATFEDNGRGMDEAPLDGVFTGQFNLAVASGEWTPIFIVSTPMFTREQVDPPLMLYPNPVKIEVVQDGGGDGYHKLLIDVERDLVDINTLLIDGKVRFPNGDVQNFSLTEQSDQSREHLIVNFEYGVYRVKLTAYGNTSSGRDFILDVPEYTFLAEAPELAPVTAAPIGEDGQPIDLESQVVAEQLDASDPAAEPMEMPLPEEEKMATSTLVSLIIGINLFLVIGGGVVIWLLLREKKQPVVTQPEPEKANEEELARASFMQKLKAILPSKKDKKPAQQNSEKKQTDDAGMLDLSLPDE